MSRIYKRNDIKVDSDSKVVIKHKDLPDNVFVVDDVAEDIGMDHEESMKMFEEIINDAQEQANEIIQAAEEVAERIIREAEEKQDDFISEYKEIGYAGGYEKGLEEGNLIGQQSYDEKKDELEKVINEAIEERHNILAAVEGEVIDLVLDIVKNITYGAFKLNPELLTVLVRRGISNATIQHKVSIKVSSDDYDNVVKNVDEFKKLIDSSKEIEILKDFSLLKNDCLLETEFGNIDCGLDEQLNSLKESLYIILNDK